MSKVILSLSVALALAVPAAAGAQVPDDDPTIAAPRTGTVPGRLSRPQVEEEAQQEPEEGDAPASDAGTDGGENAPTGPDSAPETEPAPEAPQGPRVLEVDEIEPDIGAIPENFQEDFDPMNPPSGIRVNIDFREAELQDVVMWISALTGRNFIIADTISAAKKITIISPQPVSIAEAYRAFIAALNMNGLTVVPFGRFLKIVESAGSERQVLEPTSSLSEIPNDDRMVTHLHALRHVALATVQPVLDALKTDAATIIPYEPANTLIITETGANLRRLLGILDDLDVPGGQEQIHVYQARYADAAELSTLLLEIFQQEEAEAVPDERPRRRPRRDEDEAEVVAIGEASPASVRVSKIISDERTNQLFVIANDRSYSQIRRMIEHLDVPIPGEGQIHVLFLENANSTELATTLQSLTQGVQDLRQSESGGRNAGADPTTATFSGELSITADEATNSLVVVASLRDFLALRSVIDQLDRRRQQVYVEAVIMEITLNRQRQLGIAMHGGVPGLSIGGEESPLVAATSLGGLSSLSIDPSSLLGLTALFQGPALDADALGLPISISSVGAILQATQTDNDVNILSTPHILTMDNEEAEIIVGENIPFISGGQGGLGSLSSLANGLGSDALEGLGNIGNLGALGSLGSLGGFAVQRQDVALTLRITPQINESNFVRLEIEEEVEDVQSIDPVLGPRTTTRQARTTVVVQDQQTIVIGGLMRDTTTEDVSKVPFLGDIPLIGRLFRHTSTRNVKTNLLLLLTPYIIRDSSDFQAIFRRKMQEREEFLSYFGRRSADYVAAVDYARKNGPMQAMLETITTAIEEEEARRRAFESTTTETPLPSPAAAPIRADFDDSPAGETTPSGAPLLTPEDATAP